MSDILFITAIISAIIVAITTIIFGIAFQKIGKMIKKRYEIINKVMDDLENRDMY